MDCNHVRETFRFLLWVWLFGSYYIKECGTFDKADEDDLPNEPWLREPFKIKNGFKSSSSNPAIFQLGRGRGRNGAGG